MCYDSDRERKDCEISWHVVNLLSRYRKVKVISTMEFLEGDRFLGEKMKRKVYKEYCRMLKKALKSKLNGGNLV